MPVGYHYLVLSACPRARPMRSSAGMVGAALVKAGPDALVMDGHHQDRLLHLHLAHCGTLSRSVNRDSGLLGLQKIHTAKCRPPLPQRAAVFQLRSTAWAMAATTPRRPWASSQACCSVPAFWAINSISRSGWSSPARRHCAGHHVRRLAHREDHGPEDRQAQACGRLLRRDRRGHHPLPLHMHGYPVSTTHTITGAIMGVGSLRRMSAVKWGVAGRIVWAWILTIPAAAAISAVTYFLGTVEILELDCDRL